MADGAGGSPTIFYLDPSGEPGVAVEAYTARLDTFGRVTIGLFSNMFIDATAFLEDLSTEMAVNLHDAAFRPYDKGHVRSMTFPAPPDLITRIAGECDAVVLAYGHCGSCTASLVRDAVALARSGVPVVALVTEKFEEEATFVARAAGIPDTPRVILPFPMAGQPAAWHRDVARRTSAAVIRALEIGQGSRTADTAPVSFA